MSGIRTRAGQAQSYRALWQRLLRSPLRAGLTVAVLVVAVVVLSHLLGHGSARTPSQAGPTAAPVGTGLPAPMGPPPPRAVAVDPLSGQVAKAWAGRWLTHGTDAAAAAAWRQGLASSTTPEYLGLLQSVDVANVPTGQVAGPVRVAASPSGSSAIALVPTSADGLVLRLTLVRAGGRWLVSYADQAR